MKVTATILTPSPILTPPPDQTFPLVGLVVNAAPETWVRMEGRLPGKGRGDLVLAGFAKPDESGEVVLRVGYTPSWQPCDGPIEIILIPGDFTRGSFRGSKGGASDPVTALDTFCAE